MVQLNSINIRPGVNVLSVLPHLNYKAWYALAEFVDNSIQNSLDQHRSLRYSGETDYQLRVEIRFLKNEDAITVTDNAAGISSDDYSRAFRPAEIPPHADGLSEFGMGMKSAACWFSPNWSVRTTALGENIERTVIFDIDQIINDRMEELEVISRPVGAEKHYTEIRLDNIRHFPKGRTVGKIRDHLASIYRVFLRDKTMILTVDDEPLEYKSPEILVTPYIRTSDGPDIEWKKDLNINLGEGRSASGFVAIRKTSNNRLAGLALFRRKRLIMGSFDETYRPKDIFGATNTFPYMRIFGEIHLRGFHVSHTKDGIKWEECEDTFLKELRQIMEAEDMPLLQQARGYRSRKDVSNTRENALSAASSVAQTLDNQTILSNQATDQPHDTEELPPELPSSQAEQTAPFEIYMPFRNKEWIVFIELSYADSASDWLQICTIPSIKDPEPRKIAIRIAMMHPFMAKLSRPDSESFKSVLGLAAAIALSEVAAGEVGDCYPCTLRRFVNEILREQLSGGTVDD